MYYFEAIKNALKQENLNPEIEEKLLQLQRYQEKQMKQEPEVPVVPPRPSRTSTTTNRLYSNKRPLSATQKSEDIDWSETPKKKAAKIDIKKEESRCVKIFSAFTLD